MRSIRRNIYVDSQPWLRGFFGLDWFPSEESKERARRYEEWIQYLINKISKPATGFWMLSQINAAASLKVVIQPWIPDPEAAKEQNATGLPYVKPENYRTASPVDKPSKPVDLDHLADLEKKSNLGLGGGSNATVYITPWWYGKPHPKEPALDADELLHHELTHAMNSVQGVLRLTGRSAGEFDTLDEFCAITLTNMYSAQTGRRLRRDHHGHTYLPQSLCNSANFYQKYSEECNAVNKYHPELVKIYKYWNSDTAFLPFNPFGTATTRTLPDM